METEVSENSTLLIPIVFDRQAGFSLAITHFQSIIRGLFFSGLPCPNTVVNSIPGKKNLAEWESSAQRGNQVNELQAGSVGVATQQTECLIERLQLFKEKGNVHTRGNIMSRSIKPPILLYKSVLKPMKSHCCCYTFCYLLSSRGHL